MVRALLALVAGAQALACSGGTHQPVTHSETQADIELHLEEVAHSTANLSGDDVKLRFTLTNPSTVQSVRVNGRGVLAGQQSPNMIRDVWLRVVDRTTGHPLDFGCLIRGGPAEAEKYSTIAPGRSVSFVRDLGCFSLDRPGTYLVSAQIDVAIPSAMIPPGVKAMRVPTVSNQIGIEIAPALPKE